MLLWHSGGISASFPRERLDLAAALAAHVSARGKSFPFVDGLISNLVELSVRDSTLYLSSSGRTASHRSALVRGRGVRACRCGFLQPDDLLTALSSFPGKIEEVCLRPSGMTLCSSEDRSAIRSVVSFDRSEVSPWEEFRPLVEGESFPSGLSSSWIIEASERFCGQNVRLLVADFYYLGTEGEWNLRGPRVFGRIPKAFWIGLHEAAGALRLLGRASIRVLKELPILAAAHNRHEVFFRGVPCSSPPLRVYLRPLKIMSSTALRRGRWDFDLDCLGDHAWVRGPGASLRISEEPCVFGRFKSPASVYLTAGRELTAARVSCSGSPKDFPSEQSPEFFTLPADRFLTSLELLTGVSDGLVHLQLSKSGVRCFSLTEGSCGRFEIGTLGEPFAQLAIRSEAIRWVCRSVRLNGLAKIAAQSFGLLVRSHGTEIVFDALVSACSCPLVEGRSWYSGVVDIIRLRQQLSKIVRRTGMEYGPYDKNFYFSVIRNRLNGSAFLSVASSRDARLASRLLFLRHGDGPDPSMVKSIEISYRNAILGCRSARGRRRRRAIIFMRDQDLLIERRIGSWSVQLCLKSYPQELSKSGGSG